ncbi:phosphonate metabolism protein/1,5-bisphosphokinase (PRPP-forming) PhnN [Desulfovibrio cuneatus]|uniref:phosphonate metabolism protein/1,5-bisphosphokinase (PRPP-forming) PhnN n=1 Tax=Desulfovibrio cuneatus TaxID=159728 RepID=UPI000553CC3B|nr:phosphonate metabolism protein/1,5-bisphosphokinase (PRPP-forming) PhnN [Desulfovibrio cuneatus]
MKQYSGLLVYVVGPSGAGKDSLLSFAKSHFAQNRQGSQPMHFVRRHITRPAKAGHEDHIPLSSSQFTALSQDDAFILEWHSHGLSYGIHRNILERLKQGGIVVMNGSRAYAQEAARRIQPMLVVEITVQREVLRQRLAARGRESEEGIEARLERAGLELPPLPNHIRIDNSLALETAQHAFVQTLANSWQYVLHKETTHD